MAIVLPDYNNSILNLTISIMKKYGLKSQHQELDVLDKLLSNDYKNIVVLTLDGLGSDLLKQLLPKESFLRTFHLTDISSVYPCTTTAATTTMKTGLTPSEHGWLGWNAWFKEYGCIDDLFLDRNSLSGDLITPSPAGKLLAYEDIISLIQKQSTLSVNCQSVMPPFEKNGVNSFALMAEKINYYCKQPGSQLIIAYWYEPDTLMHKYGPLSSKVKNEMHNIDLLIQQHLSKLEDTLLIITADHGQIEIKQEVFLDDIPELMHCLILPPTIESRAASFFVKEDQKENFCNVFEEIFQNNYLLLTRQKFFDLQLLGPGQKHYKVDDFIGDFMACGTGNMLLRFNGMHERERYYFKGHHAGLCHEEMIVPLIIADYR